MIDSIIFDVDGTLWDTTPLMENAWNEALADFGHPDVKVTADRLKGLFGLPSDVIASKVFPGETWDKYTEFAPFCSKYEFRYLEEQGGTVYPDYKRVLEELSSKYPLYIVSNCQPGYIDLFLRKTGFTDYFSGQLCFGDTGLPKSENIKKIVSDNDLKFPIYVGDTQMDADSCAEANVPICFAAYGFGHVDKPDYSISRPLDLLSLVDSI